MALDATASTGDRRWLEARKRFHSGRLPRLQRSDDHVPACIGFAKLCRRPRSVGRMDKHLRANVGHYFGQTYLHFPPLFGHQFTHVWVDFRNIQDDYMRAHGIDYFENSRRATYAQRAYAIDNPLGCKDYGESVWGITASDGPANVTVQQRVYRSYAARGIGGASAYDDCTLAPTAAAGSIPFAPEITIPTLLHMHRRNGQST